MQKPHQKFTEFELNDRLLQALSKLGLEICTSVQEEMLPIALEGKDILVSAETGSGKTIAYLLPILQKVIQESAPNTATRCLILAPTRELANQIESNCKALCKFTQISCLSLIGGLPFKEQKALVRKNPEIIIATPGRVLEHVQKGSVDLSDLEALILDEADRMLDMGFRDDVMEICQACQHNKQTILLSATLQHTGIERVAESILKNAVHIEIGNYRKQENTIEHKMLLADSVEHKSQLISKILLSQQYDKVLIFTNTRNQAKKLDAFLRYKKLNTDYLHGELSQEERQAVMEQFRLGKKDILVATDLAARGLDIKGLDLVINFDMARSGDDYIHRIGRTGRAGESGTAISLINANDWNLSQSIARYLNLKFEAITIKGLDAKFKGKVSNRPKKNNPPKSKSERTKPKAKQRQRNKKNIGKRRVAKNDNNAVLSNDGLLPLKKK